MCLQARREASVQRSEQRAGNCVTDPVGSACSNFFDLLRRGGMISVCLLFFAETDAAVRCRFPVCVTCPPPAPAVMAGPPLTSRGRVIRFAHQPPEQQQVHAISRATYCRSEAQLAP